MDNEKHHRPWGYYEILSDHPDHKVKRVTIEPGKRLSLQKHEHRNEHWVVVHGKAMATVNGSDVPLSPGGYVDVPCNATHRMANIGSEPMVFVETQTGASFLEEDITRYEDDFGRV